MYNEMRPLTIRAGDVTIAENYRIRVKGSANMTLLPDLFVVDVYNLPEEGLAQLNTAGKITVIGAENSMLFYGEIQDVFNRQEDRNVITSIAASDGQTFWETPVFASYGSGLSVRQTILALIGQTAHMGSFLADDLKFPRGQTFDGRLPYAVSDLARAVNARAFVSSGALHVVSKGRSVNVLTIPDEDILLNPAFADGTCVLKTTIKGYPIGMMYEIAGKNWRLVKQVIEADNQTGPWRSELTLVDEERLSASGMGGGI